MSSQFIKQNLIKNEGYLPAKHDEIWRANKRYNNVTGKLLFIYKKTKRIIMPSRKRTLL